MRQLRDYVAPGVSIGIIWLSFRWLSQWGADHRLPAPGLIALIVAGQLALLLSTFGHELGHLIAGWISGQMLRSFQAGPFRWERLNGKWGFDFELRKFYSGSVSMIQPDVRNMRSRKAFFLMGGPAASLVLGSISIVATLTAAGHAWEPFWTLLSLMASFSIAAFIANLIPHKPDGPYGDGARLRQIVGNGPWANLHLAFAMLATSAATAARPRDLDVNTIHKAELTTEGERGLLLRLAACEHYLDADQTGEALVSLRAAEALYEQCTFERPEDICAEFAFINAFYKRDLAAAELWWERIEVIRNVEVGPHYWRAWTALLWLKGDKEEAREALHYGSALALQLAPSGMNNFMRLCFEKLREALVEPTSTGSLSALAAACNGAAVEA